MKKEKKKTHVDKNSNLNCDDSKNKIMTCHKLKFWQDSKVLLWQNSNTLIVTLVIVTVVTVAVVTVVIMTSFSKNNFTHGPELPVTQKI